MEVLDLSEMRQNIVNAMLKAGYDGWVEIAEPHVVRSEGTASFSLATILHPPERKPGKSSFDRGSVFVRVGPWGRA